jgi:ABC-2 type transport system ATP-binding protein
VTSPGGAESAATGTPAVRVQQLRRAFGPVTAVDGLSFDVRPGELFGLVGPDGAGKTTTLRLLAGVLRADDGDAHVYGTSVRRDPEGVKRRLAYMSQRFGLYTDLTVRENLEFYADLYEVPPAERPQRFERLYRFSNLGPFRDRLAGKLSGGMKQKLGLSCALVHQPELLLLDEPTFGVDPVSRRDLWLIVHERVSQGVTAIVSTAYMDEAERFDRVALLHRGRLLALDTPRALQGRLGDRVLGVRLERPRQARAVALGHPGVAAAIVFGTWLRVVLHASASAAGLGETLAAAGFTALELRPLTPSMEDVFVERVLALEGS